MAEDPSEGQRHRPDRADPAAGLGSRYHALRLARRFRQALHGLQAQPPEAPGLSLHALLALHGQSSIGTLLMLFSLFCILPVGGVGNVFGVALWMLSWHWYRGHPDMPLPNRLAALRVNRRWSLVLVRWLGQGYRQAGRWMRPRWPALQAPWMRGPWAAWIALQALVIFLPIPLGNILPAFSLVALGLGHLIRDGVMHGLSLALGLLSLLYTVALGQVTWLLVDHTWHWLWQLWVGV